MSRAVDKFYRTPPQTRSPELERLLLASAGLGVVGFDDEGRVVLYDEGADLLFGLSSLEAPTVEDIPLFRGSKTFRELLRKVFDQGSVDAEDLLGLRRDGQPIPVRMVRSIAPRDGALRPICLVPVRDVAAWRQAESDVEAVRTQGRRRMHQSEKEAEFLRELLRHTSETIRIGLAVQDLPSGMIAYVNESFEEITGLERIEVLGMTFCELFEEYPLTRDLITHYVDKIRKSAHEGMELPPSAHWNVTLRTGEKKVEVYGRPIVVEGHDNQYILLIIEDHTERQRLQAQLVQSEKLAAVGQLAAGIAHEIRNPLNTIYNALYDLTELIENPCKDVAEDISISMEEIKRVQDIINNLLDFARDTGRITGESDLNDVIRRTVRLVGHDLKNKKIELTCDLGEIPDVQVSSNALKQILINLITNAAQAMADTGGGSLRIRTHRQPGAIPVRCGGSQDPEKDPTVSRLRFSPRKNTGPGQPEDHVRLEVVDSGPGIPSEIMSDIFNPFYTTKPPGQGTGLGLSVVHSLVSDSGGAISVESRVGSGTTFVLELPSATGVRDDF